VKNILFEDCYINTSGIGFEYNAFYGGHPIVGYDTNALPVVTNITARRIHGRADTAVAELKGLFQLQSSPYSMRGLVFEDVHVQGGEWECENIWGVARNVTAACSCLVDGCVASPPSITEAVLVGVVAMLLALLCCVFVWRAVARPLGLGQTSKHSDSFLKNQY